MSIRPPRDRAPNGADFGAERLGPYVLLGQVSRSDLSSVYVARPQDGLDSAPSLIVKRLRREHARDPIPRTALLREAALLAQLRSPFLVRSLMAEDEAEPYTVLERVQGANLARLLAFAERDGSRDGMRDTTRLVIPLVVDALRALQELHRPQPANEHTFVVHQAPCARHILVGVDGRARLLDLTLATGPRLPRLALSDERLRPEEMAPEQALAPLSLDPRCDLFIVGITLWEALTGRSLFGAASPDATLDSMLRSTIVPPSQAGASCDRAIDQVCLRALQRPRSERYRSAEEMANELREEAIKADLYAERDELGEWVRSVLDASTRPGERRLSLLPTSAPPTSSRAPAGLVDPDDQELEEPSDVLRDEPAHEYRESLHSERPPTAHALARLDPIAADTSFAPDESREQAAGTMNERSRRGRVLRATLLMAGAAGVLLTLQARTEILGLRNEPAEVVREPVVREPVEATRSAQPALAPLRSREQTAPTTAGAATPTASQAPAVPQAPAASSTRPAVASAPTPSTTATPAMPITPAAIPSVPAIRPSTAVANGLQPSQVSVGPARAPSSVRPADIRADTAGALVPRTPVPSPHARPLALTHQSLQRSAPPAAHQGELAKPTPVPLYTGAKLSPSKAIWAPDVSEPTRSSAAADLPHNPY